MLFLRLRYDTVMIHMGTEAAFPQYVGQFGSLGLKQGLKRKFTTFVWMSQQFSCLTVLLLQQSVLLPASSDVTVMLSVVSVLRNNYSLDF